MSMDGTELLAVRALYDAQMRRGAQPDSASARVERVGAVVRQTVSGPGWNGVVWSDLDAGTADAEIAAQIAHFAGRAKAGEATDFEWKLYDHDRPADLGERLRAAGFVPEPTETLLVARTADLAALPVRPPEGITLRVVTDEAGVDLMMEAHRRAFATESPGSGNRCSACCGTPRTPSRPSSRWRATPRSARPGWKCRGSLVRGALGRRHRSRVARARHLPPPGRPPRPAGGGPRHRVPPGGRDGGQPTDPGTAGVQGAGSDGSVRVGGLKQGPAGPFRPSGRTGRIMHMERISPPAPEASAKRSAPTSTSTAPPSR